jgi:phosphate transport system permease protein
MRPRLSSLLPIGITGLMTAVIVLVVAIILGNIIWFGQSHLSWKFLTASPEEGMTAGGIFPAIFGTVLLVFLMTIAVVPVGVVTAIYLTEYARETAVLTRLVRLAVSNLAGVPSIVFGLFGLGFFIQFLGTGMDRALGLEVVFGQPCLLWAAMTLAVLNLPVVIVSTEEALKQVPEDYRHASLALGASKWQTIWRVLLPQALPGVLTGAILAVSRGAGEVAPIMFTGAAYYLPYLPKALSDQFMELGYHVYVMATQSPDVEATKPILYGTVFVLLVVTFLLNLSAILLRSLLRRRFLGT